MTPTEPIVTILAGTLIIAGVALLVTYILLHQARMEREQAIQTSMWWTDEYNKLKKELDSMRSERNAIEDELTAAKSDIEWERVKHRQQKESKEHWKSKAEQATADIEQWKALYIEQRNRANRFKELHTRMTKRPRDPKTGRIIPKAKAVNSDEVVKLCDEIKVNAVTDITPKPHTLRHGMTVKDPTPEQAKEIFEEAKRLGIDNHGTTLTPICPWINYEASNPNYATVGTCAGRVDEDDIYLTPDQFLAHMRGE